MPFKFNGATIFARELTIGEDADCALIAQQIIPEFKVMHLWFAEYELAAIVTDGKEPIVRITAQSSPDQIRAAYAEWTKLPRGFRTKWRAELEKVENTEGEASTSSS